MSFQMRAARSLCAMAVVVILTASVCLDANGQSERGPAPRAGWTMHRGDLYGTGQAPDPTDVRLGKVKWTFLAAARISHTPVVDGGTVFVGDWAGVAYALDAATGKLIWDSSPRRRKSSPVDLPEPGANPLDAEGDVNPYKFSSFVLSEDLLFAATLTGIVTAFKRADGEVVWEREFDTEIYSSLRVVSGKLLFGATDNHFRALDAATGEDLWSYEAGDWIGSTCAVLRSGTIVFPSHDKFLHLIALEDGKLKRRFDLEERSTGSPLIAFGCAYLCTTGKRFKCIDLVDGTIRWEAGAATPHQQGIGLWKERVMVHIGPHLICYRAVDGEELWRFRLESGGSVSPCVGTELVYHTDKSGTAYAIDPATGKERWRVQFGENAWSSPVLAGGSLFVCDGIGRVRAIE